MREDIKLIRSNIYPENYFIVNENFFKDLNNSLSKYYITHLKNISSLKLFSFIFSNKSFSYAVRIKS